MIRPARPEDLPAINAMILRAKAHWGYDEAFMEKAKAELTLPASAIGPDLVIWDEAAPLGVAHLQGTGSTVALDDLFVDPGAMGRGIGAALFHWATLRARALGAHVMTLDSDPNAEAFYLHLGATRVGESPSGSIPGRMLPRMEFDLSTSPLTGAPNA